MKLKAFFAVAVLFGSVQASSFARDEGHEGHPGPGAEGHPGHEEGRGEVRAEAHGRPNPPPRAAPERFQPHPPGAHPRGATVRSHPIRVMSPKVVRYGGHQWRHWEHPEFARPVYYWEWNGIHNVTCIAEDSYGDQYPVTESTFRGFGLVNMTAVEDDALDRCNAESGGDPTCYLATCSHF